MKHFLNNYMKDKRNLPIDQLRPLGDIFLKTINFVTEALGKRTFRPDRSLNTAVHDSVTRALAHRLCVQPAPEKSAALSAYEGLFKNDRFVEGYIRATADEESVKKRMEEAEKAFAKI